MNAVRRAGDQLGDYQLIELLFEGIAAQSWRAKQQAIQRQVIVEILKDPSKPEAVAAFLADVRVKAQLEHPLIGHVYEAHHEGELCYYARELPRGQSLEIWHQEGKKIKPLHLVTILQKIAQFYLYCEEHGIATIPISAHQLYLDEDFTPRLVNLAVSGKPQESAQIQSKQFLGEIFSDLLQDGQPGSTRCESLLGFMADEHRQPPLTWQQILDLSQQIQNQLFSNLTSQKSGSEVTKLRLPSWTWALAGGVTAIGLFAFVIAKSNNRPQNDPQTNLQPQFATTSQDQAIQLAAAEVTIAQYAEFLDHLSLLSDLARRTYDHPDQPAEKKNHYPEDWPAIYSAAVQGKSWNELTMSPQHPVINIDWWDAYAYANWRKERLPTLIEWRSALQDSPPLPPSPWGEVRSSTDDRTPSGHFGLSGNVSEWIADDQLNPALPLDPRAPAASGGSYLAPNQGEQTLLFLESRGTRRVDLGFRTVRDPDTTKEVLGQAQ